MHVQVPWPINYELGIELDTIHPSNPTYLCAGMCGSGWEFQVSTEENVTLRPLIKDAYGHLSPLIDQLGNAQISANSTQCACTS